MAKGALEAHSLMMSAKHNTSPYLSYRINNKDLITLVVSVGQETSLKKTRSPTEMRRADGLQPANLDLLGISSYGMKRPSQWIVITLFKL